MNFSLDEPALLLLVPLALALAYRLRVGRPLADAARWMAITLAIFAAAGPSLRLGEDGRDLWVVVDRSASMPATTDATAREWIGLLEDSKAKGRRLGVIAFGREPRLELHPEQAEGFADFRAVVQNDGSDVAGALELALRLVPVGRPGRILLLSDGEASGRDPLPLAREARERGIEITAGPLLRPPGRDLLADRIELPEQVAVGEPFQFRSFVHAAQGAPSRWRLTRDGREIARGQSEFRPGWNSIAHRDIAEREGVSVYALELLDAADPRPENDRALGALRVVGARPILVYNELGHESALVRALGSGGIAVEVRAPRAGVPPLVELERYSAVVLENVAGPALGNEGLGNLSRFVLERGRGLLMTGGRASFVRGGYWRSPLDPALAVDLEPRDEDRRMAVAVALALDRSGSMAAPAGGRTKMDLANDGASRAVELLGPLDYATVIAVDTQAHVVVPLTQVQNPAELAARARRVRSQGGGIFVRTALRAMVEQLESAPPANRHLILFADAADSEEQEDCLPLAQQLAASGAVLSVIGLGSESDSDGPFLKALAAAGGGNAWFTTSAADLPELFAQEVAAATRGGLVEEAVGVRALLPLAELGAPIDGPRAIAGYHLARARERTATALSLEDGRDGPLLVYGQRGLGRSAAYLGQVGGELGAELVAYGGFAPLFSGLARWLAADEPPADFHVRSRVERGEWTVEVELAPEAAVSFPAAALQMVISHPSGPGSLELQRTAADRLEGSIALTEVGVHLGRVDLGDGRSVDVNPAGLSASPEHTLGRDPAAGPRLLERLEWLSGGTPLGHVPDLWLGPVGGSRRIALAQALALLCLALWVLEVAARRLALGPERWPTLRPHGRPRSATQNARSTPVESAPTAEPAAAEAPKTADLLESIRARRRN